MPRESLAWELVKAWEPGKSEPLKRLANEPLPDEQTRLQLVNDLLEIAANPDADSKNHALMILRTFRSRLGIVGDQSVFNRLQGLFREQYTSAYLVELAEGLHRKKNDNESRWKRGLFRSIVSTLAAIDTEKGGALARSLVPIFAGTKLEATLRELENGW